MGTDCYEEEDVKKAKQLHWVPVALQDLKGGWDYGIQRAYGGVVVWRGNADSESEACRLAEAYAERENTKALVSR